MKIACADCGCVVDRGNRLTACADPNCCCQHLPRLHPAQADRQDSVVDDDTPDVALNGRDAPAWGTPAVALTVVLRREHLRATIRIALIVGTALFAINQLDVVLRGDATAATWVKVAVTYVVPFIVSNLGILTATRRPAT